MTIPEQTFALAKQIAKQLPGAALVRLIIACKPDGIPYAQTPAALRKHPRVGPNTYSMLIDVRGEQAYASGFGKVVAYVAVNDRSLNKRLATACEVADRSGCVKLSRARATGTMVGLYRSAESFEADPELPWTTVCEEHDTLISHPTRKLAEQSMPDPRGWCDDCREAHP